MPIFATTALAGTVLTYGALIRVSGNTNRVERPIVCSHATAMGYYDIDRVFEPWTLSQADLATIARLETIPPTMTEYRRLPNRN